MTEASNPYQAPLESASPNPTISARWQLLPVAVTLLVISILHIAGGLFYLVYTYSIVAAPNADPEQIHLTKVYGMYYGISMLYCLLLVWGAFSMLRMGSYVWALTVCILALVPFLGPCYLLAVPIGIWGILILRRTEVRVAFAGA